MRHKDEPKLWLSWALVRGPVHWLLEHTVWRVGFLDRIFTRGLILLIRIRDRNSVKHRSHPNLYKRETTKA